MVLVGFSICNITDTLPIYNFFLTKKVIQPYRKLMQRVEPVIEVYSICLAIKNITLTFVLFFQFLNKF